MPGKPGTGGPVPKRSDQRRRNNKPVIDVDTAPAGRGVADAPAPDPEWHPIAREWFESLGRSGQSVFFEPSDWATARLVAQGMHELLSASRLSAQLFQSVLAGTSSLLATEGDRRRLRIELARADEGPSAKELAATADLDAYRQRLGG